MYSSNRDDAAQFLRTCCTCI